MKKFFAPNITRAGRVARAVFATLLLVGGIVALQVMTWLSVLLIIASAFVFFEAARGWCVMRACGIRTMM